MARVMSKRYRPRLIEYLRLIHAAIPTGSKCDAVKACGEANRRGSREVRAKA